MEYLRDYIVISCWVKKRYQYLRYKVQIDQKNILPENIGYVRLLQRLLKSRYCYLQQKFLGYADVRGSKTNPKSQALFHTVYAYDY